MFEFGDHVEYEVFPGRWVTGTVYAVHRGTVVILADQPSQLIEVTPDKVRKA
jgi:hypothetical protein